MQRWMTDLIWGAALAAMVALACVMAKSGQIDFLYQNF